MSGKTLFKVVRQRLLSVIYLSLCGLMIAALVAAIRSSGNREMVYRWGTARGMSVSPTRNATNNVSIKFSLEDGRTAVVSDLFYPLPRPGERLCLETVEAARGYPLEARAVAEGLCNDRMAE